jgi:hypothetical protein
MTKSLILSILFVTFFTLSACKIFACSCIIPTTNDLGELVEKAYINSEVVFSGKVIEINRKQNFVNVKFKVEKSWKNISKKEVSITTGTNDGDCGYKFEVGKKYLVYTHDKNSSLYSESNTNFLITSICTRTALLKSNEDVAWLNKIIKSKIKSSPK